MRFIRGGGFLTQFRTYSVLTFFYFCVFFALTSISVSTSEQTESNSSSNLPSVASIIKSGILRVAIFDGNVPPFFLTDKNGELTGIDVKIAKDLASEIGVKAVFIKAPTFDGVIDLVKQRKADIGISKLSVTLDRAKVIRYAGRYVTMGKALLINRVLLEKIGDSRKNTLQEIFEKTGAKIAVIEKSSFERFAKRIFPNTEVVTFKNWSDIVDAVIGGEILAAFRDEWEVRKVIVDYPNAPLVVQGVIIKGEIDPIEMVVDSVNAHFAVYVNKFLEIQNINYNVTKLAEEYKKYK